MTLIELKKSLHEKIDKIKDRKLLETINAMLDNHGKVFIIPEHMKAGIEEGIRDIENGHFHTIEEFEKKYEKYLKYLPTPPTNS